MPALGKLAKGGEETHSDAGRPSKGWFRCSMPGGENPANKSKFVHLKVQGEFLGQMKHFIQNRFVERFGEKHQGKPRQRQTILDVASVS